MSTKDNVRTEDSGKWIWEDAVERRKPKIYVVIGNERVLCWNPEELRNLDQHSPKHCSNTNTRKVRIMWLNL